MPNRIIKESICTSNEIETLTWEEEVFFYRLIVNCDDFGYMDARLPIIKSKLFPLRAEKIKKASLIKWLQKLIDNNLIMVFKNHKGIYLYMVSWITHQQIRAKRRKYPEYQEDDIICNHLKSDDFTCTRNPIQSNPNPNPNSTELPNVTSEQMPVFLSLLLNDKTEYPITEDIINEMKPLFASADIEQEFCKMKAWCLANPRKRKTIIGIKKFYTNWLLCFVI